MKNKIPPRLSPKEIILGIKKPNYEIWNLEKDLNKLSTSTLYDFLAWVWLYNLIKNYWLNINWKTYFPVVLLEDSETWELKRLEEDLAKEAMIKLVIDRIKIIWEERFLKILSGEKSWDKDFNLLEDKNNKKNVKKILWTVVWLGALVLSLIYWFSNLSYEIKSWSDFNGTKKEKKNINHESVWKKEIVIWKKRKENLATKEEILNNNKNPNPYLEIANKVKKEVGETLNLEYKNMPDLDKIKFLFSKENLKKTCLNKKLVSEEEYTEIKNFAIKAIKKFSSKDLRVKIRKKDPSRYSDYLNILRKVFPWDSDQISLKKYFKFISWSNAYDRTNIAFRRPWASILDFINKKR